MSHDEEMLRMPHPVSLRHPPMNRMDRAAQFSPFAALTGYEDAVRETARLTEKRLELDESAKEELDRRLRWIQDRLEEQPAVCITYFKPDERKCGGAYVTACGTVKKMDLYERTVTMTSGEAIPVDEIRNVSGEGIEEAE